MNRPNWYNPGNAGELVYWFDEDDPDPAAKQIDKHYQHGGGWRPSPSLSWDIPLIDGVVFLKSKNYPEDQPYRLVASTMLRNELIMVFESDWVAITQTQLPNDQMFTTLEVARVD